MDSYKVEIIPQKQKNEMMFRMVAAQMHEKKADVQGTCIKFFTDNGEFAEMWENNFRHMIDSIRPHGRIFAVSDSTKKLRVLYEPVSKTVIIKNCSYYGWIKSIALALVADFFEDFTSEHRRDSIHGSFVEHGGHGIAMIGPSGSGKTTLTYGLLLEKKNNFVTDDWFFVRSMGGDTLVFSAEKNSYIREDLARAWPEFQDRARRFGKDSRGRSIVDIKRVFGAERIREVSNLKLVVLLKRKKGDEILQRLDRKQALEFMLKNDFCNPHQLVRSREKLAKRRKFFFELFDNVPVYLLNTIETPGESLRRIRGLM